MLGAPFFKLRNIRVLLHLPDLGFVLKEAGVNVIVHHSPIATITQQANIQPKLRSG